MDCKCTENSRDRHQLKLTTCNMHQVCNAITTTQMPLHNDESTKQPSNHNTQQSQSQKRALRARSQQAEFDEVDAQELSDSDDDLEEEEDEFNLTYSISPKKEKSSITKKHKSSIAMPPLPKNKSTVMQMNLSVL
eukprot:198298_1